MVFLVVRGQPHLARPGPGGRELREAEVVLEVEGIGGR